MNSEVNLVGTARLLLLQHVGFVLVIKELNYGHPGISVVHVVSKTGGIDNGKSDYKGNI